MDVGRELGYPLALAATSADALPLCSRLNARWADELLDALLGWDEHLLLVLGELEVLEGQVDEPIVALGRS